MFHAITMYHGLWYANHATVPAIIEEQEQKRNWKRKSLAVNWQGILFYVILFLAAILAVD